MTRALGALMVLTAMVLGLASTPAHAADELGLSWDSRTWSGQLDGSLFDPQARWVPGDVRTAEFYVRNQAEDRGTLTVSVTSNDPDRLLRNDEIDLLARVGAGEWVALEAVEGAFRLHESALAAGATQKVRVRASFDSASLNPSQRDRLGLDFRVTLADADATPGDDPTDPTDPAEPDGGGGLPNTGAPVAGWVIVLAGIAVGVGLGLMRRRKREEVGHGTTR